MHENLQKHLEKVKATKSEVVEKLATLITAAFGFVAAFAWNDSIKAIFAKYLTEESPVWFRLGYAVVITILAVLVTIWVGKAAQKLK